MTLMERHLLRIHFNALRLGSFPSVLLSSCFPLGHPAPLCIIDVLLVGRCIDTQPRETDGITPRSYESLVIVPSVTFHRVTFHRR
jgi:hypothetical protein